MLTKIINFRRFLHLLWPPYETFQLRGNNNFLLPSVPDYNVANIMHVHRVQKKTEQQYFLAYITLTNANI